MKKITVNRKVVVALSALTVLATSLADQMFKDVPSNHWARPTIEWGVQKNIIHGYGDDTFRPDQYVSEAEFLTMLINTFAGVQPKTDEHWASGYYEYAKRMNWVTAGATNKEARSWKISRKRVAEIVSGANGVNYTGDNAIRYLLAHKLAVGKNPNIISVDSFKGQDYLTRAEAVQFIKNAQEKGLTQLKSRPVQPSDPNAIPKLPGEQINGQTPVLHEVEKRDVLGKLPKSPETQPTVEAFIKNIRFEGDKVYITIPPIPKGYRGTFVWNGPGGNGLVDVKAGQKMVYSIKGAQGFGFGIFKGYIGVNTVAVELPSGAYWWGAEK
jgi:hypothetical protein